MYYYSSGDSMKKKLLFSIGAIILIFIVGVTVYKFPNMLTADSGFDSSWSSGGSSYSGGSSWSSSSSWDSGSSYSSGSSSSSSSGSITVFDFFLVVLFLIIISMLSGKEEVDRYLSLNHKEEIDDSEFRKYISIPMQQFKKERFEDYKETVGRAVGEVTGKFKVLQSAYRQLNIRQ